MARGRAHFVSIIAVACSASCRCGSRTEVEDAGPPPLDVPKPLPPPKPWTFIPAPHGNYALPEGCIHREPPHRAQVATSTRFLADPRSLGVLIVADANGEPPELTGVAALPLVPKAASGTPAPVPWFRAAAPPRLARTEKGAWIGAIEEPLGPQRTRVLAGGAATLAPMGEGDGFTALDIACSGAVCALLTTRPAPVAQPGAAVWIGAPDAPPSSWRRVDLVPPPPTDPEGEPARALSIAGLTATEVLVALVEDDDIALWAVALTAGEPHETARLEAPFGTIDVSASPAPTAIVYGAAIDAKGCPEEPEPDQRSPIRIERHGAPPIELRAAAPPLNGALRQVGDLTLATWLVPNGCRATTGVVYGVVLDAKGASLSQQPMAIGEASSYAAAASGGDVDLWFQHEAWVTWVRAKCRAP